MTTKKTYPVVHTDKHSLFTFVERGSKDVIICVGNKIASSQTFETVKKAQEFTEKKTWELLVNVMCIVNETMKNYEKETTKTPQEEGSTTSN